MTGLALLVQTMLRELLRQSVPGGHISMILEIIGGRDCEMDEMDEMDGWRPNPSTSLHIIQVVPLQRLVIRRVHIHYPTI
jgi:hypothetical protein